MKTTLYLSLATVAFVGAVACKPTKDETSTGKQQPVQSRNSRPQNPDQAQHQERQAKIEEFDTWLEESNTLFWKGYGIPLKSNFSELKLHPAFFVIGYDLETSEAIRGSLIALRTGVKMAQSWESRIPSKDLKRIEVNCSDMISRLDYEIEILKRDQVRFWIENYNTTAQSINFLNESLNSSFGILVLSDKSSMINQKNIIVRDHFEYTVARHGLARIGRLIKLQHDRIQNPSDTPTGFSFFGNYALDQVEKQKRLLNSSLIRITLYVHSLDEGFTDKPGPRQK